MLDEHPTLPGYVVEKRGQDSLGEIKWDLEPLATNGYKTAVARALEDLTKEPEGFVKCEWCGGSGWDGYGR